MFSVEKRLLMTRWHVCLKLEKFEVVWNREMTDLLFEGKLKASALNNKDTHCLRDNFRPC
jgi:hypothetical protein